jgi:hypothetical protein
VEVLINDIYAFTGRVLLWLFVHTSYHMGLIFKDTIGNLLSAMIGFIIAILFFVFIVKAARLIIDENTEHIFITKIKKNKRTKIFITMPPDKGNNLSTIMGIALLMNVALVKLWPIKQIQFVGRYKIYICFWTVVVLIVLFIIFGISINYHLILPNNHGGYIEY